MFYFYQILSPLSELKSISEGVLLLPNIVPVKRAEDDIRGCSTSTKYCPLTSWRLYQRVFYFYQKLSPLNELKTISEGVLLLPNTVPVKRAEDYIRGCSTSTKYCPLTGWRIYQRVFYFYQILSSFKLAEDNIRGFSTSTKYCPLTGWRLYQRVFYFYQILSPLSKLKTISESVLLLPNTVSVKRAEDYIRGCSTSTKYCPLTSWRLYQRVFYFYQILSPLNELKTISEDVLLLPNTVLL